MKSRIWSLILCAGCFASSPTLGGATGSALDKGRSAAQSSKLAGAVVGTPAPNAIWVLKTLSRVPTKEEARWLANALERIDTIRPGMTRADLLRVFTTEGGLSTRTQHNYVLKDCPYLKVRVTFRPVNPRQQPESRVFFEGPEDVIVTVSKPFVQATISD